ncbi:gamma carbonic anhydrase family protein [Priestia megaterium]|uniref:gamma carbonic anhydrase family protein n=1 Tax=Priestia megaterium TaxID=1404 RepID=UPI003D98B385
MHIEHQKRKPIIHSSAWVASNAVISGEVIVEEEVYISYGAVIIAERAPIHIKKGTIIMDNVVLKSSGGKTISYPLLIEEHTLIGPYAYLIGCTIKKECFLAAGAKVYNGAYIGEESIIEINGTVHDDTKLAPRTRVPVQHSATGEPVKLYPPDSRDKSIKEVEALNFLDTLFQVKDKSKDLKYVAALEKYRHMLFQHKSEGIIKNFDSKSIGKW